MVRHIPADAVIKEVPINGEIRRLQNNGVKLISF
jgi:hypothetical protein